MVWSRIWLGYIASYHAAIYLYVATVAKLVQVSTALLSTRCEVTVFEDQTFSTYDHIGHGANHNCLAIPSYLANTS